MKTENKILDLSFEFSLQIIQLYKILIEQKEYVLSKQLLKIKKQEKLVTG